MVQCRFEEQQVATRWLNSEARNGHDDTNLGSCAVNKLILGLLHFVDGWAAVKIQAGPVVHWFRMTPAHVMNPVSGFFRYHGTPSRWCDCPTGRKGASADQPFEWASDATKASSSARISSMNGRRWTCRHWGTSAKHTGVALRAGISEFLASLQYTPRCMCAYAPPLLLHSHIQGAAVDH